MGNGKLDKKFYRKELERLQVELVKLQEWVKRDGLKVVVILKVETPLAKVASSNALPKSSTLVSAASQPYLPQQKKKRPSGTSSVM